MSQFVYFLPGLSGPARREQLEAAGLGYAFPAGQEFHCVGDSEGPHGMGCLVSADPKGVRFAKDSIEWNRGDHCFVGMPKDKAKQPKPTDLRKTSDFVDGHPVKLGNGETWIVPVVRFADGNTSLPCVLRRKDDGSYGYEARAEYRGMMRICDDIVQNSLGGEGTKLPADQTMAFVSCVLGVNYRISDVEISALELVDSFNVKLIASAALDQPSMVVLIEELKKKITHPSVHGPDCATGVSA